MRRYVLSLAVAGVVALSACDGGGSVLRTGTDNPDRVVVTTVGSTNIGRVLYGQPLQLSATGATGSQNGVSFKGSYTWTAAVVTSGQYAVNTSGQTRSCGQLLLTQVVTAPATPPPATAYAPDFTKYLVVDSTNSANVTFTPPATIGSITAPTGFTVSVGPTSTSVYCVAVSATNSDGKTGTEFVAVVNPAAPLQ